MHLHALTINNFRGIKSADILLDDTTIFIGENDCGKTSILDALSIALSNTEHPHPVFEAQHFHHSRGESKKTPAGDIFIELIFKELVTGEWQKLDLNSLASLIPVNGGQTSTLHFQLTASPSDTNRATPANWSIYCPGNTKSVNDIDKLNDLRRLNPIIWLRGSTLLGVTANNKCDVHLNPEEDIAPLVREIEHYYRALITGGSNQTHDDIKAGYKAARSLLELRATDIVSAGSLMHPMIADILGNSGSPGEKVLQTHHGSAALQTGVFILTAALLSYFAKASLPGVEPKLLLEDPEANLHLMTLASVWSLLKHINAQKIITTQSGTLLAATPLHKVRRLTRFKGIIKQWYVRQDSLKHEELRKLSYHVRVRRGSANFARCWLLVEGETEFWVLPELAVLNGYDFNIEGIAVVEFAQCGLAPLIKLAKEWGIEWHVLSDGDKAGQNYTDTASHFIGENESMESRVTRLHQKDIEHCFWSCGYKDIFEKAANRRASKSHFSSASNVINRAINRHSKPYLAFEIIQAASTDSTRGTPKLIKNLIEVCVDLARYAPQRNTIP